MLFFPQIHDRRCLFGASVAGPLWQQGGMREMREGRKVLPPEERAGLFLPALRPPHSPDGRHALERSRTPLQKWFYALYLFTTTRHGVSAKELQRQLGVTYKCAWRMGHQIRKYMAKVDGDGTLNGIVELGRSLYWRTRCWRQEARTDRARHKEGHRLWYDGTERRSHYPRCGARQPQGNAAPCREAR